MAYFSLFNFPLTESELYFYLWEGEEGSYDEFKIELQKMLEEKLVEDEKGFYFLPGQVENISKRESSVLPVEKKIKKAKKAARLISFVPFLKAIFVCNSVAGFTAGKESDIDFFIIGEENRLWLVRFFTNLILRIFGLRTFGKHNADRVCLSFYAGAEHLDLSPWKAGTQDIYLAIWLSQLLPVFDPENYLQKIRGANSWSKIFLPNTQIDFVSDKNPKNYFKNNIEKLFDGQIGNILENLVKKIQYSKLQRTLKKQEGSGVVIENGILKFHEHDRRVEFYERWVEVCKGLKGLKV